MAEPISIGDQADKPPRLAVVGKFLSTLSNGALYIAGAGLVVMTAIVFWQVFLRYVLNHSNAWTELTSILLMSWFIFLGSAVGVRENYHLGFDVLLYVLPKGSKRVLRTISDVVVIGFSIDSLPACLKISWSSGVSLSHAVFDITKTSGTMVCSSSE